MSDMTELDDANRRFLDALRRRRPADAAELDRRLLSAATTTLESTGAGTDPRQVTLAIETIVSEHRPVLFVTADGIDFGDLPPLAPEARTLVTSLQSDSAKVAGILPLVGRIDVSGFAGGIDYLGTGWFIAEDVVVTNRHVAALIAQWNGRSFDFIAGASGRPIGAALGTRHQKGDEDGDDRRAFKVEEVLYIEPAAGPNDIAFLRVRRNAAGTAPRAVPLAAAEAAPDGFVCTIGYPAEGDPAAIPNQDLMRRLYQSQYDVKRIAPGLAMAAFDGAASHDCTTLGGCSGGLVLDPAAGAAVGLHFAGIWRQRNLAVPVAALKDYVARRRWLAPPMIETGPGPNRDGRTVAAAAATVVPAASANGTTTWTIPLTVTVGLGTPVMSTGAPVAAAGTDAMTTLDEAVAAFWKQRPAGVLAVRAGFLDEGDAIGDTPCIAASVRPAELGHAATAGPAAFMGYPVRYDTADRLEQVDTIIRPEAISTIAYDDDARTGEDFSFETVVEPMRARLHVGPEYSWDELERFLAAASGHLVSAIYEFHGDHIRAAIEARLEAGIDFRVVMDNVTFSEGAVKDGDFDRGEVFAAWRDRFAGRFHAIVPREGTRGLVARAYHIKVSVREDDTIWLSSGNWKRGSSQPVVTEAMRANATVKDLPGNREWHIVLTSPTLARRFRAHIGQDFVRAAALASEVIAEAAPGQRHVDIAEAVGEAAALERRPPAGLLAPKVIERRLRVRPLLTPDARGAVYAEAVLDLIRSARERLWFQIPYIAMPSSPNVERGYIDELIAALADKLKRLPDARVILRSGGSDLSNPAHAAWHFKARGVDIAGRLRQIDNHHTKGMIVDGRRVLIGSHNWSGEGVTLNRDASLIVHDEEVAAYYADAFTIDWDRARPISPKKSAKAESTVLPAEGPSAPAGYRRVSLSELLSGDL